MTKHDAPPAMSLFDLIARSWDFGAPVRDVRFNAIGSSVAVGLDDGTLAFLPMKDAEDPETRMRVEADTGRMTIRPRSKALPTPVRTDQPQAAAGLCLCRVAQQGFAFVHSDGAEVWRATARGQTLRVARAGQGPITALATLPDRQGILVARGPELEILSPEDGLSVRATALDHDTRAIATSSDAGRIACWGPGRVTILRTDDLSTLARIDTEGEPGPLGWSPDGRWLIGGCGDKAVLLVDTGTGAADRIVGFPAPVAAVGFSRSAGAMMTSGAFRVTGWRLPDLPFGDHEGTPVETGKPGLTIVEKVAVHPARDLCAAGYANGLVTLCQIGRREEMMLREGGGDPVTALEWSADGAHLAIGTAGGTAAVAAFPKAMFK
ncbi:WD40 repeat domain-containing protein [Tropicibacter alexandrii]|uniref:WD40 repeat domain-containing protein n=1 Tax=Tropicibacter alexandrii TaxID=2267683 RepID=UPI000EF4B237|nr:hypothetical protein [Tropicibacter alexandrii]